MNKSIKKNPIKLKAKTTSTFILIAVFLIAALSGTKLIQNVVAIDYTQYTGTLDGADWALRIPDPWNGMLVVVCRGVIKGIIPDPLSYLSMDGGYMLNQGYAVAASNYGEKGFCVQAGVNSTYELTKYIIENYNVKGRVFLRGASLGGCVALLLGEKYPNLYSGVLDLFGPKNHTENYLRNIRWANLSLAELEAEMLALGITTIPPPTFATLEDYQDRLVNSSLALERETGGTPETHPQEYEDRSPVYHANITIPVITVHGLNDAIVFYYNSEMYRDAVADAGCSDLYRLYAVEGGGHNGGTSNEAPERFDELVEWSNYLTGVYDWPMFGYNPQRTGFTDSPAPSTNQTLWTSTVSVGAGTHTTVADDKLFIGAWDNRFYCFDATNGTQLWNYTTAGPFYTNSAYDDGRIYLSSTDSTLYCLNASTGASIWNYTMDDWAGAPAIVDGIVYAGSDDYNVYCLNATTGTKIWNYTTGGRVAVAPAVADGLVYVGSVEDYTVYCLNATTGAKIWNYTTGGEVWSSAAVADGLVYVGSNDYNVYCLNATTGAKIWNYTTGANIDLCSPAVAYGSVYVGSADYNVYCLNATTGAKIWNYTTGSQVYGSPAVADGKVYATSLTQGILYCLNAYTGGFIWSYDTSSSMLYSGAVVANGVVYVVSGTTIYAIPESYTIAVVMLLSIVSVAVSFWLLRKRPKYQNSALKRS